MVHANAWSVSRNLSEGQQKGMRRGPWSEAGEGDLLRMIATYFITHLWPSPRDCADLGPPSGVVFLCRVCEEDFLGEEEGPVDEIRG